MPQGEQSGVPVKLSISDNIDYLKSLFNDSPDIIFRFYSVDNIKSCLIYISGLVQEESISFHTLKQMLCQIGKVESDVISLEEHTISMTPLQETADMNEVVTGILSGNMALVIDAVNMVVLFKVKSGVYRSITEPTNEAVIRGPREGFIEDLSTNIVLLRQKIRSHDLKIAFKELGQQTKTKVAIVYLENMVNPSLLKEVHRRIDQINIDGVLETEYIEEFIEDNPLSPFPQIQNTERPDTVTGNLLEGRVAILCDGAPSVLIVPSTFWQLLQSSEDYYNRFYFSILQRSIRYFFLLITLLLPAMYIAVSTFHIEMIPTSLLLTFMASREKIPFPAMIEALMMEVFSEALREAGVRLPKVIGQTVSILGAIVIGTATVEAGIVSAPMVIIVSVTGIAGSTIPGNNIANSIRLLRFPLMILAGTLGLFGIMIGLAFIAAHLCSLRSFGTPFMAPLAPMTISELKDVLIRAPWWMMTKRSTLVKPGDVVRQNQNIWRKRLWKKGRK